MPATRRTDARRTLVRLLAERLVRDALSAQEAQEAERAIIDPAPSPTHHARRPLRPIQLRPAATNLDR